MRFLIRKRRTAPAVIIVALIDVLVVLVIFLLVTTTFKQRQPPLVRVVLPESTTGLRSGANDNPPLLVTVEQNGVIRFGVDNLPMRVEDFRYRLLLAVEKMRAANRGEVRLAIRADKAAPWGQVVQVMDIAKEANIKILSAYTREAAGR
jgi:biopolymer transport protein ExbD